MVLDSIHVQNFHYLMVTWVVDISSSVHTDNKGKDILIFVIRPTQGLDDTTLTTEAQY